MLDVFVNLMETDIYNVFRRMLYAKHDKSHMSEPFN